MRVAVTTVLITVCLCGNAAPDESASLSTDQILGRALSGDGLLELSKLDPAVKQEMRRAIRSRMQGQAARPDRSLTALINLGDTNAMQQAMALRNTSELFAVRVMGQTLQRNCDQPQFLPFLAHDLLIDEPSSVRRVHGDVALEPRSVDAAKIMRAVLARSAEFPPGVRTWAEQLDARNRERIRLTMRKWWEKNSAFVTERQYSNTQALEPE